MSPITIGGPGGIPGAPVPWVPVDSLAGSASTVSDWGPILNAAYASSGVHRFLFRDLGFDYPWETPLDFNGSLLVTLQGESGGTWVGDQFGSRGARPNLVYKGSGSASAIDARASEGFTIRDLGVHYDNSAGNFTGSLIDATYDDGLCAWPDLTRCHIGGGTPAAPLFTAFTLVNLDKSIGLQAWRTTFFGAEWLVMGRQTDPGGFSQTHRFNNCTFGQASIAQIGNIWEQWLIDGCGFEMGATPLVISDTFASQLGSSFTFSNNWVGDSSLLTGPLFSTSANAPWNAKFTGNKLYVKSGPLFKFLGGGNVQIVDNPGIEIDDESVVVDLGDTGAGAVAFTSFRFEGNDPTCTAADAVIHRAGHSNLNIHGNSKGAGVLEQRSIGGHELLGYPDRQAAPSIVKGSAAPNATVGINGTDTAGQIQITPNSGASAGQLAVITFGAPFTSNPGAPFHRAIVMLSPGNDAAAAALGYQSIDGSETSFQLACHNAPGSGDLFWNYRIIGM